MFSKKIMNKKVKNLNLNDIADIAHTLGLDLNLTLVPIKEDQYEKPNDVKPTEELKTKSSVINIDFDSYVYNGDTVWVLNVKEPGHNTEIDLEFVCVNNEESFGFSNPIMVKDGDFVKFEDNYWEMVEGTFVLSPYPEKLLLEKKIEQEATYSTKESGSPEGKVSNTFVWSLIQPYVYYRRIRLAKKRESKYALDSVLDKHLKLGKLK
ncbi:MAG: hypothetical protein IBX57_00635 [Gammaproteobacteria bacterium]|nr:hypothetical protein [Gammaproteobacteria bacterium]